MAPDGGSVEIWGDGEQTRSFLYIEECLRGTTRLMRSNWQGPVNICSNEMISINQLVHMVASIAGKKISTLHIPGPLGVRSHNKLILEKLGWQPTEPLAHGLTKTYALATRRLRPNEGSLDDPPAQQKDKTFHDIAALDDFDA